MKTMEMSKYYDIVVEEVIGWFDSFVAMLPNFVLAVLAVILFAVLGKLARRMFSRVLVRALNNPVLSNLLSRILYIIIVSIGGFVALNILDLEKTVTSLLAGAGIVGLALGFAFQDIAMNFIAGFLMAVKRPFKVGQVVHCNGISGVIKYIGVRTTQITSFQGQEILVPNKILFQNPLTNDSENIYKRIDLEVGVSYSEDLEKVREITLEAVKDIPNIYKEREISLAYGEFGASSINFTVMIWVEFKSQLDFLKSRSEAIIAIKKAYDKTGITIPFPIRTLDFGEKESTALRAALHPED